MAVVVHWDFFLHQIFARTRNFLDGQRILFQIRWNFSSLSRPGNISIEWTRIGRSASLTEGEVAEEPLLNSTYSAVRGILFVLVVVIVVRYLHCLYSERGENQL